MAGLPAKAGNAVAIATTGTPRVLQLLPLCRRRMGAAVLRDSVAVAIRTATAVKTDARQRSEQCLLQTSLDCRTPRTMRRDRLRPSRTCGDIAAARFTA